MRSDESLGMLELQKRCSDAEQSSCKSSLCLGMGMDVARINLEGALY